MTPNISPFRPGGRYFGPLIGVVALAIVAALASFVFFGGQEPVEEPEPVVEAVPPPPPPATPPPVEEPEEEVALPSLDDSDSLVRDFVAALTSHPAFAAWLIPDQLVRTFVLVVENAADGNNPAAGLTPLRPTQRFSVRGEAPAPLSVNPASYARYNTHAEIVASINPVGAAELYRRLYPLITEAYAELGHPDGVDVVLDMVQGELFEAALVSSVRPLGRICLVGFTAGQKPIRPGMLLIKQAAAIGSLWGPWATANPKRHQENVSEILAYMASGAVEPRADRVFPLDRFIEAFELFENNEGRGNTVVCFKEE